MGLNELNAVYVGITIAVVVLLGAIYASLKYISKERERMAADDRVEFKESNIIEENLKKIDEIKQQYELADEVIYEELIIDSNTTGTAFKATSDFGNDKWNTEPCPLINEIEIKPTNFGNLQ